MANIVGAQTITIGSDTDLSFVKSWVPKYANEIKKGNTMVKKSNTADRGDATLRVSHQVSKGIEGHVISLEIEGVRGTEPAHRLAKAQIVVTCDDGDSEEIATAKEITAALCTYVPTVIDDIFADVVD